MESWLQGTINYWIDEHQLSGNSGSSSTRSHIVTVCNPSALPAKFVQLKGARCSTGLVYLPTFTIEINQIWVSIPYMDGMGYHSSSSLLVSVLKIRSVGQKSHVTQQPTLSGDEPGIFGPKTFFVFGRLHVWVQVSHEQKTLTAFHWILVV